jgi:hypothetical protein
MHPFLLLLLTGIACGFLNAAASSGSAISLPVLIGLGLPPAVANATNRLPVVVGMAIALLRFQRAGAIPWGFTLKLLPAFLAAATLGALGATRIPMQEVSLLIHIAILVAFLLLLLRPSRWLNDLSTSSLPSPSLLLTLLTAAVGLWTGLIVLDAATYLLVAMVMVGRVPLVQANAIKTALIGTASVASLVIFLLNGQVDWMTGLPLMLGSSLGGWLGAALALGPNARQWIYRLLVSALGFELLAMLWSFRPGLPL